MKSFISFHTRGDQLLLRGKSRGSLPLHEFQKDLRVQSSLSCLFRHKHSCPMPQGSVPLQKAPLLGMCETGQGKCLSAILMTTPLRGLQPSWTQTPGDEELSIHRGDSLISTHVLTAFHAGFSTHHCRVIDSAL